MENSIFKAELMNLEEKMKILMFMQYMIAVEFSKMIYW
jgi:hypothetical protein